MFLLNAHGVKPLKNKKGKTVVNVFLEIVNESNRKPKKLWVDQGIELYNKLLQEWLDNNDVLMYSTHNEGESVINERFIKTKKAKIYKGKSYLAYLNELIDQYKDTYHHFINKKPINANYSALTEKFETNPEGPKFQVNDSVRITKYKNIFSKSYTENWLREILIIDSALKTNPWAYKVKDLNVEIIGSFYEKIFLLIKP